MRLLLTIALVLTASIASAQTDLPRLQAADVTYEGSFTAPPAVLYGGYGLGVGGGALYVGCGESTPGRVLRMSIPALGETATLLTPCTTFPNRASVDTSEWDVRIGGVLVGSSVVTSMFSWYDNAPNATRSHWTGAADLTGLTGPVQFVGEEGWIGGYMGWIPSAWRTLFGGPALTGLCCVSIISRSSYGPTASVFDPAHVGTVEPVPNTRVLGYDATHPLGPFSGQSTLYNGTTMVRGIAFPTGTRTVLFVGRQGTGPYCYGTGSACGDPVETSSGNHAYPYQHQVWAYDANDLLEVKAGTKQMWEVQPYATFPLTGMGFPEGTAPILSAAYDDAARKLYVIATASANPVKVHVFGIAASSPPPPPPPDTVTITCAVVTPAVAAQDHQWALLQCNQPTAPLPVGSTLTVTVPRP